MNDPPLSKDQAPAVPGTKNLLIRAARVSDFEGIAALSNLPGYRAGTLRLPYQNPELTRKWLESQSPDALTILAEQDGKVIGLAGLNRHAGRRSHAAELWMGVHDDYQ